MSAQYKIVENPKPNGKEEPLSYHARFIPKRTIRMEQLCKEISGISSFSPGDVKGLIEALSERITHHLEYGSDVDVEGLGHFTVTLRCEQPKNGGRHTAVHIDFKTVKIRCSKYIKDKLKTMHFEPVPKDQRYTRLPPERRRANILRRLARDKTLQSSDCMAINGCSRYMALTDLKALLAEGKIRRLGHRKSAVYCLPGEE